MSAFETPTIDLIRELRLRKWARTNYVPIEQRIGSWHPLVLDEMQRRDEELRESVADKHRTISESAFPDEEFSNRRNIENRNTVRLS